MTEDSFDTQWKFKALELAAMEQLESEGVLNKDWLFKTGREIYEKGYKYHLEKWDELREKKNKKEGKNNEPKDNKRPLVDRADGGGVGSKQVSSNPISVRSDDGVIVNSNSGSPVLEDKKVARGNEEMKVCPACQEQVPIGWNIHKFKTNTGVGCGYRWD